MEQIILRYGIAAIFLGAAIEGEPFALAGGVLAHRGWMSIPAAALAAILGALAVDQLWFHLSRRSKRAKLVARMTERPAFAKSLALIDRHPIWFILLFRFAYGVRAVAPVAIGVSKVPARLFVPLNVVSAIVWGCLFTALGWWAGPAFEAAEAKYGSGLAIAGFAISALALALVLRRRR